MDGFMGNSTYPYGYGQGFAALNIQEELLRSRRSEEADDDIDHTKAQITEAELERAMNQYRDGTHGPEIDAVVAEHAPEIYSEDIRGNSVQNM